MKKTGDELRYKAEQYLSDKGEDDIGELSSEKEARRLIHELRVHQIELEMQNDELRKTQNDLESSRDEYENLYDFAPVGYLTLNDTGIILKSNLTFSNMIEMDRRELISHPLSKFIHPEDHKSYYLNFKRALGNLPFFTEEIRFIGADSKPFHAKIEVHQLRDHFDKVNYLLMAVMDISDLKKAGEERLNLEKRLFEVHKNESITTMAGGIAHNFNNILTSVIGNLELALGLSGKKNPDWRNNVKKSLQESKRAAELSSNMLVYLGQQTIEQHYFDLVELIKNISEILQVTIAEKAKLEIEFHDTNLFINGDSGQISQAIVNVITNSIESIENNKGLIKLSAGAEVWNSSYLGDEENTKGEQHPQIAAYIKIEDNGCGMDSDTLRKAFDPFFSTKFAGRGLGLSIVKGIVNSNNGMVFLMSQPNKGTMVKMVFPAISQPSETEQHPGYELQFDEVQLNGKTVLIIDDEKAIRSFCKSFLDSHGVRVLTAGNGLAGFNLFKKEISAIDCVLLDISMPIWDGRKVLQEIRKLQAEVPVIIITGFMKEQIKPFGNNNFTRFLHKPFAIKEFLAALYMSMQSKGQPEPYKGEKR